MMPDKRDECGCHRECTHPPEGDDILGIPPHTCAVPCRWPACLTEAEQRALLAELDADETLRTGHGP